jgi:hypothetical protein
MYSIKIESKNSEPNHKPKKRKSDNYVSDNYVFDKNIVYMKVNFSSPAVPLKIITGFEIKEN